MKNKSENGFSLPGLLMTVAAAGIISMGSLQLMKSTQTVKKKVDIQSTTHTIQKFIESELFSPKGCEAALVGHKTNDEISLRISNTNISAGSKYGELIVESFRLSSFTATDETQNAGIARLTIITKDQNDMNRKSEEIIVPVTIGLNSTIVGCDLFNGNTYMGMFEKLCEGSFGSESAGKNCPEVLTVIREKVIRSICDDIYGVSGEAQMVNGRCDLRFVHINKTCPGNQVVKGFDEKGMVICASI